MDFHEEHVDHFDFAMCGGNPAKASTNDDLSDNQRSYCIKQVTKRMLEFVLTNLKEGAISELKEPDSDWRSNGVLRSFWQEDFLSTYLW